MENKPQPKVRVAVLFGGRSAEHEVSLQSAKNVIQHLDATRFDVIPVGIDKQGNWLLGEDVFTKSLSCKHVPMLSDHTQTWFTPAWITKAVSKQPSVAHDGKQAASQYFDVVFPVVHGTLCEDGTLQGLLELADLPYVGCGVLSSAVGMDKDVSKRLAMQAGIPVPDFLVYKHDAWQANPESVRQAIMSKLPFPVFVKPVNTGSSIGVNKAKNIEQLNEAIEEAFRFDTKVIVEKGLNVIELEVAVLEAIEPNAEPIASVVGEIRPSHEFYSYDAKYIDEKGAELFIPASVPESVQAQASALAKQIFEVLDCEGMARVDLFYDKDSKQVYFNEVNTIPGFTQISMYPKLMAASGIAYTELLTKLIMLALKRHHGRHTLSRTHENLTETV